MRQTFLWTGLAIIVTGIAVLVFADVFTDMDGVRGDQIASLVFATALLIVIGSRAFTAYRGQGGRMLQHAALWLAIVAAIALFYNYRGLLGFS